MNVLMVPAGDRLRRMKREYGEGVGISRQIRDCPRNCKRRAILQNHCPAGMGRRRKAETRESGDLPSSTQLDPGGASGGRLKMIHRRNPLPLRADIHPHSDTDRNCPHLGAPCLHCETVCARLGLAIAMLRQTLGDDFDIRGEINVTTCPQPCRLAFRCTAAGATCLGNIPVVADIDALWADAGAQSGAMAVARPGGWRLQ